MNELYEKLLQPDYFDWSEEFNDDNDLHDVMKMTEYAGDQVTQRTPGKSNYQEDSSDRSYERSDTGHSDSHTCSYQTQQSPYCVLCVESAIDVEFSCRELSTDRDDEIHHYNFHGEPVNVQSTTSAEESLVIILSTPKDGFKHKKGLLMRSLLNCAHVFLDPVILFLDQNDQVLKLRGTALVDATEGRVNKYYSPHGTWFSAEVVKEEIVLDYGDQQQYRNANLAVANGF
ncbi:uncharacterized protein N7483_009115 [Penicillium malachiteum]|uniref:uncharacterized protein n=1 Tax=Penicillium malachiteum TaxID=1324776 RepID=UPI0025466AC0|nr:uncharacterized protein N7483_009115 [Penicillium malachiteum]KAJ5721181.1 hypothetical protein N7483_009115 [Penicillium malachiteum]